MSMWKAALLGLMIPTTLVLPALAQDGPQGRMGGPQMMFETFDLDGDGAVTLEEMTGAREARFAEADANGDGVLQRDELLAAATDRMARGVDRMIERADADGDGAVSLEEMAEMRNNRRGPGPEAIFERFDVDGDGSVTEAEFDEAVARFRERRGGHEGRGGFFGHRDRG
jgi:Ca2+-binding EF-hand superfamily protein